MRRAMPTMFTPASYKQRWGPIIHKLIIKATHLQFSIALWFRKQIKVTAHHDCYHQDPAQIDLQDFLRLFLNHRPARGEDTAQLEKVFKVKQMSSSMNSRRSFLCKSKIFLWFSYPFLLLRQIFLLRRYVNRWLERTKLKTQLRCPRSPGRNQAHEHMTQMNTQCFF